MCNFNKYIHIVYTLKSALKNEVQKICVEISISNILKYYLTIKVILGKYVIKNKLC